LFFTNVAEGASFPVGTSVPVRGIALGGDTGVAKVELSSDVGKTWQPTTLGKDYGKYSFRQWETNVPLSEKGSHPLMVRCTNLAGDFQPSSPNWNTSGFMRNVIETVHLTAT
jgi:Mo-co oxidoreductase dimerisation domain